MKTTPNFLSEKESKEIHLDILEWKSRLQFIDVEVYFINQLLHSYIFESTTPNLFERLQEFKQQITKVEEEILKINQSIRKHESELGGTLERDTISEDHSYYQEHELMKITFANFYKNFRKLKLDVFSYTGSILKGKKL